MFIFFNSYLKGLSANWFCTRIRDTVPIKLHHAVNITDLNVATKRWSCTTKRRQRMREVPQATVGIASHKSLSQLVC